MKPLYYIIILVALCVMSHDAFSQQDQGRNRRQRNNANNEGLPELSVRAQSKNTDQTQNIDNVVWLREMYRYIDLKKEENAPLYYPIQPIGDRMNLFTLIFKLMCEGKIKAYNYIDGREVFTEEQEVKFEEVLKSNNVIYEAKRIGPKTEYIVRDSDIPSSEVLMYMVKEAWYFDQANGTFDMKVLAICPMLVREEDDFAEPTRTPLFWLPYENIRPYISRSLIMTSNINNALTYTTDDYFSKKMYKGDIVKTTNLMGQSLAEQFKDSISGKSGVKYAQDSIEAQLKFFEEKLWVPKDSTLATDNKKGKKSKSNKKSRSSESAASADVPVAATATEATSTPQPTQQQETKEEKPAKAKKPKATKSSSSSSPTKSVRRTR